MASTSLTATTAVSAGAFASTLGINTHIDFAQYGYQNLTNVITDINYLGVKIIRDSAETPADAQSWLQVAQATGAKFDDYIAETSPAGMATDLGYVQQLAQEGILASIEGGNEEDDSYPASLGNTLAITAQFQQQVAALGAQLGLPVINMSFGAGWTAANGWQGDYGAVGNLSAYATYGNAHTYPVAGQLPDATIQRTNGLAQLAAVTRPVVTTEIGWETSTFDLQSIAKYVLDAALDGIKDGNAGMYYYGMYDDGSGNWGMFNADGTARPAATALHNLTTLLADTGSNAKSFAAGSLSYSLGGTQAGDSSVLIEKSNGSFWLSLWNETEAASSPHTVTVTLGSPAATVVEFDPLTGTSAVQTWNNTASVQVAVPDHPVLLEIIPGTTTTGGGGTTTPPTPTPPPPPTSTGPVITVPASASVTAGATATISGVSVADSFAAANPGNMVLNLSAGSGLLTITDASGNQAAGSGSHAITYYGSLAQLTTELAHLSYTAASSTGSDNITVDVWDQAGLEATKYVPVSIAAAPVSPPPPSPPPAAGPAITVPASVTVAPKATTAVSGISVVDAFAASNPGSLALTVNAGSGTVSMTNSSGAKLSGSGTHSITFNGTLAQISYDLAHLSYTAGSTAGSDSIGVDLWDQAGREGTKSIAVSVKAATTSTATTASIPAATATTSTITIAATDANPVITVSNATISAVLGNHMIFIGGSNDVLTATGGTETVQAFQGNNKITTGTGNDVIQVGGSNNVINAGSGTNEIDDSGSGNTIVLPSAFGGQAHDDIFGYVLQNQDLLDMRSMLAGTQWNGSAATLGNYLQVGSPNGSDTTLSVLPTGTAAGGSYNVATLHGAGAVNLATLLAHSIT